MAERSEPSCTGAVQYGGTVAEASPSVGDLYGDTACDQDPWERRLPTRPNHRPANERHRAQDPGGTLTALRGRQEQLLSALSREVLPNVSRNHAEDEGGTGLQRRPLFAPGEVEQMAMLCLQDQPRAVAQRLDELTEQGLSIEAIAIGLLSPAARHLGELWKQDRCSFIDVTLGLTRLQAAFTGLSQTHQEGVVPIAHPRRILLMPARSEQHTFGLRMVGEFFRWDGWDVRGAIPHSRAEVRDLVSHQWFDTIGISVGSDQRLDDVRLDIEAARKATCNPMAVVMVGGPVILDSPDLTTALGADAMARDASHAPADARLRVTLAAREG